MVNSRFTSIIFFLIKFSVFFIFIFYVIIILVSFCLHGYRKNMIRNSILSQIIKNLQSFNINLINSIFHSRIKKPINLRNMWVNHSFKIRSGGQPGFWILIGLPNQFFFKIKTTSF